MRIDEITGCAKVNEGSGVNDFLNSLWLNWDMHGSIV